MAVLKYPHVSPELQEWCDLSNRDRCRAIFEEKFVSYPKVKNVIKHIKYQISLPKQTRAHGLMVYGRPGSGKTQLAAAVKKEVCRAFTNKNIFQPVPVVSISMTGAARASSIYYRVFEDMGVVYNRRMSTLEVEILAIKAMRRAGVVLIVLDEMQDILSSTDFQQMGALNVVKLLMNSLKIPILALGTEAASKCMAADPHLAARFDHHALPVWKPNNELQGFLAALVKTLPLRERSNLGEAGMVKKIATMTAGSTARIVRLINTAAVFAIQTGTEKITAEMLDLAATDIPDADLIRI